MTLSNGLQIRAGRPTDFAAALELLKQSGLPTAGVPATLEGYVVVVTPAGSLAGLAGLERYGTEGLLRSVVVAPELRGTGLGKALSERVVSEAGKRGVTDLYLLTTTAEGYFPKLGFAAIAKNAIPSGVQQSLEFRGACPDTAIAMHLALG